MDDTKSAAIELRQAEDKKLLLGQLKKTPVITLACEKVGVGRATYYRWKNEDSDFRDAAQQALDEGVALMNDLAESKLLGFINNDNLTATMFWLKSRHRAFSPKLEVSATNQSEEVLTAERQEEIRNVIKLASPEVYQSLTGETPPKDEEDPRNASPAA